MENRKLLKAVHFRAGHLRIRHFVIKEINRARLGIIADRPFVKSQIGKLFFNEIDDVLMGGADIENKRRDKNRFLFNQRRHEKGNGILYVK